MKTIRYLLLTSCFSLMLPSTAQGVFRQEQDDDGRFTLADVFELEFASSPEISPDGNRIVFVRNFMDIMTDRPRSNLWIVNYDGSDLQPLTNGNHNYNSPRWSPDGKRLLYTSNEEGSTQLYVRWMETGQIAKLTQLTKSPGGLAWSPDGQWIA
ncbi:MAG: PD40 domain-containing protein, partial [Gemmatimonadetes bacterium]|nr:PD40 domain-containing protein [Gemmatimonadota bacterium]